MDGQFVFQRIGIRFLVTNQRREELDVFTSDIFSDYEPINISRRYQLNHQISNFSSISHQYARIPASNTPPTTHNAVANE